MSNLTELCRPLFVRLCEIWAFKQRGAEVSERTVRADLRSEFDRMREAAVRSEALQQAYARIEMPLVFFIDYTIKEGGFSYSNAWRELARDYNELSGDEKFFDLLKVAEAEDNNTELLEVFYLMLELGFDGALKRDPDALYATLHRCGARVPAGFNPMKEAVTAQPVPHAAKSLKTPFLSSVWFKVLLCALLALSAFSYNLWTLNTVTRPYMKQLQDALYEASPEVWVGTRGTNRGDALREDALSKVKSQIDDFKETAPSKAATNASASGAASQEGAP